MKLQITNICRTLGQEDFRRLFEKYGPLSECTLVMDPVTKKSKGFGFVVIDEDASAKSAVESLNGRVVDGMKIKVKAV